MDSHDVWTGSFPVCEVQRFPDSGRLVCVRDPVTWQSVWSVFRPESPLPVVDFQTQAIVVFRNTQFRNSIGLSDMFLDGATLMIEVVEQRTARPLRDALECLLILVDLQGVTRIECGGESLVI